MIFLSLSGVEYKLGDSFQHISASCKTRIIECGILPRIFIGLTVDSWGGALSF